MTPAALVLAVVIGSGGVGSAQEAGVATWCAPTPTRCQSWGGDALVGATRDYAGKPYPVTVTHGGRSVTVTVVSWCACGDRHGKATVIDLSVAAFRRLAPLSAGVIDVVLERVAIALPPTDTAPTLFDWLAVVR